MNAPRPRESHIDAQGWITSAARVPSPKFEAGPGDIAPTFDVIRDISHAGRLRGR